MKPWNEESRIRGDYTPEGARACIIYILARVLENRNFDELFGYRISPRDYAALDVARSDVLGWLHSYCPDVSFDEICPHNPTAEEERNYEIAKAEWAAKWVKADSI